MRGPPHRAAAAPPGARRPARQRAGCARRARSRAAAVRIPLQAAMAPPRVCLAARGPVGVAATQASVRHRGWVQWFQLLGAESRPHPISPGELPLAWHQAAAPRPARHRPSAAWRPGPPATRLHRRGQRRGASLIAYRPTQADIDGAPHALAGCGRAARRVAQHQHQPHVQQPGQQQAVRQRRGHRPRWLTPRPAQRPGWQPRAHRGRPPRPTIGSNRRIRHLRHFWHFPRTPVPR